MKKVGQFLCAVTALAATACNNPPPPATDAGTNVDGGGGADTGPRPDTGVVVDGGGMATSCASPIDLSTVGTALTSGTGRTYHTTNAAAPAAAMSGITIGSCADDGMGGSTAGAFVVFSYTVQTGGHLRASTDDPATDAALDTVVWVLDGCTATANELACDDDVDFANMNARSTALSAGTVAAGTRVTIIVGGFAGMSGPSRGAFTLNVSELPEHAAGETCDAANPFCVDGYACVPTSAMATSGTCNAFGTDNAPCNITAPFCNTGLGCTEAMPTAATPGVCQVPIAAGEVCTPDHFLCVTGNSCQPDEGSSTMGHCLPDGTEYGQCRLAAPFCDTGLTCSEAAPTADTNGTCQMPVANGGVCTARHFLCVTGNTCIADAGSTTMGHCIADGAMGGACRAAAPECDGTLTCDANGLCN